MPSFVADFVSIESWVSSDGQEYHYFNDKYGTYFEVSKWMFVVFDLKFKTPLISIRIWKFFPYYNTYWIFEIVVNQNYESELMPTEYVIRGNSAILKCSVPSFVADFITVEAWVTSDGQTYTRESVQSKYILKLWNLKWMFFSRINVVFLVIQIKTFL